MRTLTKTGIRILSAKYRSILIKCAIINASVFIGAFGAGSVMAVTPSAYTLTEVEETGNWNYYDIVDGVKTYYRITPLSTNTNHYTIAPEGTTDFTIRSNTGTDSYHVTVPGTASSELRGSLSGNVGSGTAQLLYFDRNNTDANLFDAGAITNLNDANNYDIYADFVSNHTATYGGAIRNGGDNSTTAKIHIINGDFVINQSGYNNSRGNGGPGGAIVNGVNSSNATIDIIQGNFIGNQAHKDSGGAIMNQHLIGTITGDFLANSANSSFGGVISNIGDDSVIDSINGNFVSNLVTTVDSNWPGVGGAIYNSGTINNINGDFILNMADKNAGAIKNARTINNINGDFILNSAMGDGGAIRNSIDEKDNVTVAVATIANITGNFIGNHAEDNGGAIYNNRSGQITEIIGDFIDNAVTTYAGGAVYNLGQITGITGKFKNNSAGSTGQYAFGGAIYNSEGTIGTITGVADESGEIIAFEGNTTGTAGGAIYNNSSGQITKIIGDFNNNKTTNLAGGAIYNLGQITSITGKFKNNSAGSTGSEIYEIGGAIYNAGTIETITGVADESGEIIAFENNTVGRNGGAVYNETTGTINNIIGSFKGNSAGSNGGAISNIGIIGNTADDTSGIIGSFIDNSAVYGGAIYNSGAITGITGSFIDNSATNNGGAIYNTGTIGDVDGIFGDFKDNIATKNGGAIYNTSEAKITCILSKEDGFTGNLAEENDGGAIKNEGSITSISSNFTSNTAENGYGGAIYNSGTIGDVDGIFEYNKAKNGGAIANSGGTIDDISGDFEFNSASGSGGAIQNQGTINNIKGNFKSNSSKGTGVTGGGAIRNNASISSIVGNFESNSASVYGGAIFNVNTINKVTGNFTKNSAQNGGAVYNSNTINFVAENDKNITFDGNYVTAGDGLGGAIYNYSSKTVGLYAAANHSITFLGKDKTTQKLPDTANDIDGIYNQGILNINGYEDELGAITKYAGTVNLYNVSDAATAKGTTNIYGGTVNVAGSFAQKNVVVKNATLVLSKKTVEATSETTPLASSVFTLDNSTLNLQNNSTGTVYIGEMRLVGSNNIMLDADLAKAKMDQLKVTSVSGDGNIVISDIKLLAPTTKDKISLDLFTDDTTKGLLADKVTRNLNGHIYSPIYKYNVLYDATRGQVDFTRYNNGGYDDVNPAIMVGAVAAQVGGYLNQINSYENAFEHMDSYMMLSRNNRLGTSLAVKYITDAPRRAWLKPYAAFETVKLKHGPKVDNNMYGSFAGLDSAIVNLKHGWDIVYSAYASYDGSNQKYDGSSIYQNGGHLGATLSLYKGNFFTGLTANAGASSVKSSTMYGTENIAMFTTGAASKTGYDLELVQDWLIVQPSVLLSYSLVNMSDYTNAAGVKISSDALHAIQIAPELKLISNLPHGWQPYIAGKTVWNMLDETKFSASGIDLPELSTKQYVQYGVGIQKNMFNGFYGYAQAMFRNGGRDGVALNAGLKMAF